MGKNSARTHQRFKFLSKERKLHVSLMQEIVWSLKDTSLVLKGGTALLLAYGLDRFSEDLDFDSEKRLNLENKIKTVAEKFVSVESLRHPKNTPTSSRYFLHYSLPPYKNLKLKIDLSFRAIPKQEQINEVNGMRVYTLEAIIEQKLTTIEKRTKARDLYDLDFLVSHYPEKFNAAQIEKFKILSNNINNLESRYMEAFQKDEIFFDKDISTILLSLSESEKYFNAAFKKLTQEK